MKKEMHGKISRRDFVKTVSQSALPMIAWISLGRTGRLSARPLNPGGDAGALRPSPQCKNDSCQSSCKGHCDNTCQGGCGKDCTGQCVTGCKGSCTKMCQDGCEGSCGQSCKGYVKN